MSLRPKKTQRPKKQNKNCSHHHPPLPPQTPPTNFRSLFFPSPDHIFAFFFLSLSLGGSFFSWNCGRCRKLPGTKTVDHLEVCVWAPWSHFAKPHAAKRALEVLHVLFTAERRAQTQSTKNSPQKEGPHQEPSQKAGLAHHLIHRRDFQPQQRGPPSVPIPRPRTVQGRCARSSTTSLLQRGPSWVTTEG